MRRSPTSCTHTATAASASGIRTQRRRRRPRSRKQSRRRAAKNRSKSRRRRKTEKYQEGESPLETVVATDLKSDVGVGDYQYGFHDPTDQYVFKSRKGLDEAIVRQISEMKNEPAWMTEFRLNALNIFFQKPMPNWGGALNELDFQDIYYFVRASEGQERDWSDVPE